MNQAYCWYLRGTRTIGHYRWFAVVIKHVGTPADRALIRASRARLSISGPELPTLLLTTWGRNSGKDRTVPLHSDCDGVNLVAAFEHFGLETASSWPKNLLAHPRARVEIGCRAATYVGRPASAAEVARNMPRLVAMWPAHDTYMERGGFRQMFAFEPAIE